jgi:hypothetical protein
MTNPVSLSIAAQYRQKHWLNYFVIYLRYLIGGAFVFSSVPKILGERFMTANFENAPVNSVPHFFETLYQSGLYWEFLGWGQLIAALLLMTQIWATLGAVTFFPIQLNIFIITVSYEFAGTPFITGMMLLANIFLLLWDYNKLQVLVLPESNKGIELENQFNYYFNNKFWALLGLMLFLTTVIYVLIEGRNPGLWFVICVCEGLLGFIYMRKRISSNRILLTN